jgi:hypothetical protein
MKKSRKEPVREDRIHNEAIVDAGPEERALSWHQYLENKIRFPLQARCPTAKIVLTPRLWECRMAVSPLRKGELI